MTGAERLGAMALALLAAMTLTGCAIGFRGPALNVTDSSVTLTGDVMSNRTESGAWWFEYGTTIPYAHDTAHPPIAFQAGVRQSVSAGISGLNHNTTFHYALCAEDQDPAVDRLCSADQTFRTGGDYVRGDLNVLFNNDIITVRFDDVESGYHGELPRGTVTQVGVPSSAVSCLNVTGPNRFTVGTGDANGGALIWVNVPNGSGNAARVLLGAAPTSCPADPPVGAESFPAGVLSALDVHDEG
jgi:hypothetical protein